MTREVWVAESVDREPARSAIDKKRLNGESRVFRYVPAAAVDSALRLLSDGEAEKAMNLLKRLARE